MFCDALFVARATSSQAGGQSIPLTTMHTRLEPMRGERCCLVKRRRNSPIARC